MKYIIIGDVHGCAEELGLLIAKASMRLSKSDKFQFVFCGDLFDRGPQNLRTFQFVSALKSAGLALGVLGNHCDKFRRHLLGNKVNIGHGLQGTIDEFRDHDVYQKLALKLLESFPYQLSLDGGKLRVAHAALPKNIQGVDSKRAKSTALYGVTTGKTLPNGFPERVDWAEDYRGDSIVVHGHVVTPEVVVKNNVWSIDTGCVFGGKLTALIYPSMEIISVDALKTYAEYPWDN